ncbi:MAG TPA: DinB family protein [Gemmatimonadales bacterium]|nr:DinB family protein [Gemmatimonadales bacterium]
MAKADRLDGAAALLKAYSASARINQYLVERLHPAIWRAPSPIPKGRTVAALVAHMHNCALRYLERTAPEAPVPAELDRHRVTQKEAARALGAKRKAVLSIVGAALEDNSRIVGSPHRAVEFLAYYMVHDAHHRGQIVQQARQLGHPISQQTMIGMWAWNQRAKE